MKKQLFRFLFVGIGANIVNFAFYSFFYSIGLSLFVSSIIGYSLGLFVSYHFGRIWVFGHDLNISIVSLMQFLIVYTVGGLGMSSLIKLLNDSVGLDYRIAWFFGALLAVVNNFLGSKWFVFNRKSQ